MSEHNNPGPVEPVVTEKVVSLILFAIATAAWGVDLVPDWVALVITAVALPISVYATKWVRDNVTPLSRPTNSYGDMLAPVPPAPEDVITEEYYIGGKDEQTFGDGHQL